MNSVVKITISKDKREEYKRAFPHGGLQQLARAAWDGQQMPVLVDEESRELTAIHLHLAYVAQQLNYIVTTLDKLPTLLSSRRDNPRESDRELATALTKIVARLDLILHALGSESAPPVDEQEPSSESQSV